MPTSLCGRGDEKPRARKANGRDSLRHFRILDVKRQESLNRRNYVTNQRNYHGKGGKNGYSNHLFETGFARFGEILPFNARKFRRFFILVKIIFCIFHIIPFSSGLYRRLRIFTLSGAGCPALRRLSLPVWNCTNSQRFSLYYIM